MFEKRVGQKYPILGQYSALSPRLCFSRRIVIDAVVFLNGSKPSFIKIKIREIFCQKNLPEWATTLKCILRPANIYAIISAD